MQQERKEFHDHNNDEKVNRIGTILNVKWQRNRAEQRQKKKGLRRIQKGISLFQGTMVKVFNDRKSFENWVIRLCNQQLLYGLRESSWPF
jgi:hypothetical protein